MPNILEKIIYAKKEKIKKYKQNYSENTLLEKIKKIKNFNNFTKKINLRN